MTDTIRAELPAAVVNHVKSLQIIDRDVDMKALHGAYLIVFSFGCGFAGRRSGAGRPPWTQIWQRA